jgi:hypothetical protein
MSAQTPSPKKVEWFLVSAVFSHKQKREGGALYVEECIFLIKSRSFRSAYRRCRRRCLDEERLFSSGAFQVGTHFKFIGISEVMPVYERFEDGAELGFRTISLNRKRNYSRGLLSEADAETMDRPTQRAERGRSSKRNGPAREAAR